MCSMQVRFLTDRCASQWFLDRNYVALKTRARSAFAVVLGLQGCWWIWSTYIQVSSTLWQPSQR